MVTPQRFAQGMAFDDYVAYTGTPENLAREAGWWIGPERRDFSGLLRDWHGRARLSEAQTRAIRWLAAQPDGPAKLLVISEEWSSDCRRDVPMLSRLADAGGLAKDPSDAGNRRGTCFSATGGRSRKGHSSRCGRPRLSTRSSPRCTSGWW